RPTDSGSLSRLLYPQGRRSFEQISFHPQPSVLLAQLGQLSPLRRGDPGSFTSIDAGLAHPVPQRALTDTQAAGHVDDRAALSITNATASRLNSSGVNERRDLVGSRSITDMVTS